MPADDRRGDTKLVVEENNIGPATDAQLASAIGEAEEAGGDRRHGVEAASDDPLAAAKVQTLSMRAPFATHRSISEPSGRRWRGQRECPEGTALRPRRPKPPLPSGPGDRSRLVRVPEHLTEIV